MKAILKNLILTTISFALLGCGQKSFLHDIDAYLSTSIRSGDIIVLSGGTVVRGTTPFALHMMTAFNSNGLFKSIIRSASATEFYMGASFSSDLTQILYTVDTADRIERVKLSDSSQVSNHIIDANLTGTTLRTLAALSDGGTVVAESTTSIEKYDANGLRVTVGFPITLTLNIMKLRKISGGRFAAISTGITGPATHDGPKIYNNAGTLQTAIALGLACTTNCDPSDILELRDGRFVISVQAPALNSLELYSSSFAYIGQLYKDTSVLQNISALAQASDDSVIACNTTYNTCEKIQIVGSTGVRVGTTAFLNNASYVRQPTDVLVVP